MNAVTLDVMLFLVYYQPRDTFNVRVPHENEIYRSEAMLVEVVLGRQRTDHVGDADALGLHVGRNRRQQPRR